MYDIEWLAPRLDWVVWQDVSHFEVAALEVQVVRSPFVVLRPGRLYLPVARTRCFRPLIAVAAALAAVATVCRWPAPGASRRRAFLGRFHLF